MNWASAGTESKSSVSSVLSTNFVNPARPLAVGPSSRFSSIRVDSPTALSDGSGMSTDRPMLPGGPPYVEVSSSPQLGGPANTLVSLATCWEVTSMIGDLATLILVGCTTW